MAGGMNRAAPIAELQAIVARHFRLPARIMRNRERSHKACRARNVGMYLAVTHLGKGVSEVGRRFKRDHTTVRNAVARVANDSALLAAAQALKARLG